MGKEEYLEIDFIPITGTNEKNIAAILCTWKNVTEKIMAQKRGEEMRKKFLHSARLAELGKITAGIAHEINQPLSIINLLADGLPSICSQKKHYGRISNSSKKIIAQLNRIYSIVNKINSSARTDSETCDLVDIRESLNLVLSFFKERFRINKILLRLDLEKDTPPVRVNKQKFEQIAVNLLNNAVFAVIEKTKYADNEYQKQISIKLSMDEANDFVVFEVNDNGVGMDKEALAHCMNPFHTTKESKSGMGLGLAIVHEIAEEFKMKIEIDSIKWQGTKFRVLQRPSRA